MNNPSTGVVLFGRAVGGHKLTLQSHVKISNDDKLQLAAHYMCPDLNQGTYEIEYIKKFERMVVDAKYSPMGLTLSGVATVAKGTFLGCEVLYTVNCV